MKRVFVTPHDRLGRGHLPLKRGSIRRQAIAVRRFRQIKRVTGRDLQPVDNFFGERTPSEFPTGRVLSVSMAYYIGYYIKRPGLTSPSA